jgi:hypothetical protein
VQTPNAGGWTVEFRRCVGHEPVRDEPSLELELAWTVRENAQGVQGQGLGSEPGSSLCYYA